MQRGNLFLSICVAVFGTILLVQMAWHGAGSQIESRLRGDQHRQLYNNYLWQRDDDDDYFNNTNNTGYFSYNQNYKAQGNGNNLGGGNYVNGGYNNYTNDDGNNDDNDDDNYAQDGYSGNTIQKSSSAFGGLSPSRSAFLGILIGLTLISVIACCLYGPTMWALFTDWLFNRKTGRVQHDFDSMT